MNKDKLVYRIREELGAISDDRYIDERLILDTVGIFRSDYLRKMISRKAGYSIDNAAQLVKFEVSTATRSLIPELHMDCTILRSTAEVPTLVNTSTIGPWYSVRTADIKLNTIEVIDYKRASYVTFEFPVVYSFIGPDKYLYFMQPGNHQELSWAVIHGVFDDPLEAEPDSEEYPLSDAMFAAILGDVLAYLRGRLPEDPINNSEPDTGTVKQE